MIKTRLGRLIEAEVRDITVNNERQCAYRASKLLQLKNSRVNHIPLNYGYTYLLLLQVRQHLSPPNRHPSRSIANAYVFGTHDSKHCKNDHITLAFIQNITMHITTLIEFTVLGSVYIILLS